jgi:hypothetical protein
VCVSLTPNPNYYYFFFSLKFSSFFKTITRD